VPRSTSCPDSRTCTPSFSRDPNASASAIAQSTWSFDESSARELKMRFRPSSQQINIQLVSLLLGPSDTQIGLTVTGTKNFNFLKTYWHSYVSNGEILTAIE